METFRKAMHPRNNSSCTRQSTTECYGFSNPQTIIIIVLLNAILTLVTFA